MLTRFSIWPNGCVANIFRGFVLVLHNKTDFDVGFQYLSSPTRQMSWKTSYCFTGSTLWADISVLRWHLNQGVTPPISMRGQLQSLKVAWMFVILRAVHSILPEFQNDSWYRDRICTVRLPMVFQYIKGTTLKMDLFQFLCMANFVRWKVGVILSYTPDTDNFVLTKKNSAIDGICHFLANIHSFKHTSKIQVKYIKKIFHSPIP